VKATTSPIMMPMPIAMKDIYRVSGKASIIFLKASPKKVKSNVISYTSGI
jgi:hypothetical protein